MQEQKKIAKKIIIIYVLNIIKLYSSKQNPITQTAICNYLNDIRIACDRKTVGRNISYLCDFGYPIKKIGTGFYLDTGEMEKQQQRNKFII